MNSALSPAPQLLALVCLAAVLAYSIGSRHGPRLAALRQRAPWLAGAMAYGGVLLALVFLARGASASIRLGLMGLLLLHLALRLLRRQREEREDPPAPFVSDSTRGRLGRLRQLPWPKIVLTLGYAATLALLVALAALGSTSVQLCLVGLLLLHLAMRLLRRQLEEREESPAPFVSDSTRRGLGRLRQLPWPKIVLTLGYAATLALLVALAALGSTSIRLCLTGLLLLHLALRRQRLRRQATTGSPAPFVPAPVLRLARPGGWSLAFLAGVAALTWAAYQTAFAGVALFLGALGLLSWLLARRLHAARGGEVAPRRLAVRVGIELAKLTSLVCLVTLLGFHAIRVLGVADALVEPGFFDLSLGLTGGLGLAGSVLALAMVGYSRARRAGDDAAARGRAWLRGMSEAAGVLSLGVLLLVHWLARTADPLAQAGLPVLRKLLWITGPLCLLGLGGVLLVMLSRRLHQGRARLRDMIEAAIVMEVGKIVGVLVLVAAAAGSVAWEWRLGLAGRFSLPILALLVLGVLYRRSRSERRRRLNSLGVVCLAGWLLLLAWVGARPGMALVGLVAVLAWLVATRSARWREWARRLGRGLMPTRSRLKLAGALALGVGAVLLVHGGFSRLGKQDFSGLAESHVEASLTVPHENFLARIALPKATSADEADYFIVGDPADWQLALIVEADSLLVLSGGSKWRRPEQQRLPRDPTVRHLSLFRQGEETSVYYGDRQVQRVVFPGDAVGLHYFGALRLARIRCQKVGETFLTDDFMTDDLAKSAAWTSRGGDWRTLWDKRRAASPNPFVCQGAPPAEGGRGVMTAGYATWSNYTFSVAVKPGADCREAGVVFAWRDERNYLRAGFQRDGRGDKIVLARLAKGRETVLAEKPLLLPTGRWVALEVQVYDGSPLLLLVDGVEQFDLPYADAIFGKIGLLTAGGQSLFDDVRVDPSRPTGAERAMQSVAAVSRAYVKKARYTKDKRDDQLEAWAHDKDAWQPHSREVADAKVRGYLHSLPIFSDFEVGGGPSREGAFLAVCDRQGEILSRVPYGLEAAPLRCRAGKLAAGAVEVAELDLSQGVRLGYYVPAGTALPPRRQLPGVSAATVQQELFDAAPVNWAPLSGTWGNTVRWQCNQNWNFFGGYGYGDVVQFSKHAFGGNQVHEFYFGMKDLYGGQYQKKRYVRRDVCFSFLTNGLDRSSGYTFIYSGRENQGSYLFRGETQVAHNPKVRFNPNSGPGDIHWLWMKLRVEVIGRRVRIYFKDALVFDYLDDGQPMPTSGHIALWTQRNGQLFARVNSSAESVKFDAAKYLPGPASLDLPWRPLDPFRVDTAPASADRVEVVNRFGGGDFAVEHTPTEAVDLSRTPWLRLWLDVPTGSKVSLHARIGGQSLIVPLTAPREKTYQALTDLSPTNPPWLPYSLASMAQGRFAGEALGSVHGEWTIDLLAALKKVVPSARNFTLERLVIGNSSHHNYLRAGFGGNASGSRYRLGVPHFSARPTP